MVVSFLSSAFEVFLSLSDAENEVCVVFIAVVVVWGVPWYVHGVQVGLITFNKAALGTQIAI